MIDTPTHNIIDQRQLTPYQLQSKYDRTDSVDSPDLVLHFCLISVFYVVKLSKRNFSGSGIRLKALKNWSRPSISELGIPTQSWSVVYARNQKRYNLQLLGEIISINSTLKQPVLYQLESAHRPCQPSCSSPPSTSTRLQLS